MPDRTGNRRTASRLPAAQIGRQPAAMGESPVSIPSQMPRPRVTSSSGERRTMPAVPSIMRGCSTGALPLPSGSRKVRWMPQAGPDGVGHERDHGVGGGCTQQATWRPPQWQVVEVHAPVSMPRTRSQCSMGEPGPAIAPSQVCRHACSIHAARRVCACSRSAPCCGWYSGNDPDGVDAGAWPGHAPSPRSASMTACCAQPAWHFTRTRPPSPLLTERLGSRSLWAGQRALP